MTLKEYIDETRSMKIRRPVKCRDGYSISVQASEIHYCQPQITGLCYDDYSSFDLGFPNRSDELIDALEQKVANSSMLTVYPYVSKEIVEKLLAKHGGIYEIEPIPEYFPY